MTKLFNLRLAPALFSTALLLPAIACGPGTTLDGDPEPGTEPDVVVEPDPEPEVVEPEGPTASVYLTNPLDGLNEVVLTPTTTDDGRLSGEFVNAINCTNQPGGESFFGFASLCLEEQTVLPDEDGNYDHVAPPAGESGEDPFAELQMYHHVNLVHDYFSGTHGLTDLDFPLDAVVNLTINQAGTWQPFDNAAFMQPEAFAQFGLSPRASGAGAIMFGQGTNVDFSYDASVIYHEYAHAVGGGGRFSGAYLDDYGLNNTPGSIGEGMADYFASTILDDSNLGEYALGAQSRNLASPRRCPDDLAGEVHIDGKIIGSALWEARDVFGPDLVDSITFGAVMSSTQLTGLEEYGTLLLVEAGTVFTEQSDYDTFEEILVDYGVIGCDRAREWTTTNLLQVNGFPHSTPGSEALQGQQMPEGVPAYHGWKVNVSEGQYARLRWTVLPTQSLFGQGPPQPVALAINSGSPVTMAFTGGFFADRLVDQPPMAEDGEQGIEIGGGCIPAGGGNVYLLFRNEGTGESQISYISLEYVDAPSGDLTVETCD